MQHFKNQIYEDTLLNLYAKRI